MRPKINVTGNLEKICKILGTKQAQSKLEKLARQDHYFWDAG